MCPFAMPSEGISIKECNRAKGTRQLHAQMDLAHMRTDSGSGGQGLLRAPLNLAAVDPVGIPFLDM